jgi:spermidine synthase
MLSNTNWSGMNNVSNKKLYFLISFIEGASVMAAELLGAKMLAPYFGSSLYVWASVLAITLGGLAAGYFVGGMLSYKSKDKLILFKVLIAASIFTALMPFSSKLILWMIGLHSLLPSVIISSLFILFPPVFMMGMVSPLIISSITENKEEAGKSAGAIYAISTLGGILATFSFGFYIIPQFGLSMPALFTGIVLAIIPCMVLISKKKFTEIGIFFLALYISFAATRVQTASNIKLVYESEGLLGQILVMDYPRYSKDTVLPGSSRWLFVNRISQTMFDSLADENKEEEKYFTYVYRISEFADSLPPHANVLLLGLGGGSIAKQLASKNLNVDVCELDKRIADVAHHYFYLTPKVNISIDDARHFIKTCNKKYDLIVFDTFRGEDPPNHVFTKESLEETKKLMNPNATIFVNSLGYLNGSIGKSMRSIYKTFLHQGFDARATLTSDNPDQSNVLFYASLAPLKPRADFIAPQKIDTADAVILSDEFPVLDMLNAEAAKRWRVMSIASFNADPNQKSLPFFK